MCSLEKGGNKKPPTSYKFFRLVLGNTSCCRDRCSAGGNPDHTARSSAFEARHAQQLQQVGAAAEMLTICAGLQSLQLFVFFLTIFFDSITGTKLGLIMFALLE